MRVELVSVGDELLRGETVNTNAAWLGRQLDGRGVDVSRVTVIPDEVDAIAAVLTAARGRADAVIVTGGLGPTHDDLTMDGVAMALGVDIERHPDAVEWIETETEYNLDRLAPGTIELPAGARFIPNDVGVAPGCVIDGIYALPGVPDEMRAMFGRVADEFAGERRYTAEIRVAQPEREIAETLNRLRHRFAVTVGSYPGETVRIRISAEDERTLDRAADWLRDRVEVA